MVSLSPAEGERAGVKGRLRSVDVFLRHPSPCPLPFRRGEGKPLRARVMHPAVSSVNPVSRHASSWSPARFTDVTAGSGLDVSFYGMGVAVGDYDNDGLPDVFITGFGGDRLFPNEGKGKFREVTKEAGLGGSPEDWSTSAAWIDYDNDGKLDLFVCNYVHWSPEIDRAANFELPKIGRAYGPP